MNFKIPTKNGFILTPTCGRFLGKEYIIFTDSKELIISNWISETTRKQLNIEEGMIVKDLPICEKRKVYLEYHRNHEFKRLGN